MRTVEVEAGRLPLAVGSELTRSVNAEMLETVRPRMDDIDLRLRDMDAAGVDMQVISITPYQMYYWLPGAQGADVSAEINDDLAATVGGHPTRFAGLGTVPLQEPAAAVTELRRCVDTLGFPGVTIGTNVGGDDLSSPRFWDVFEAAEDLDAALIMHSSGYTCPDRLEDHYFMNVLGHPFEGSVALAHLIFDGVLERFPALKLVVAHGGGYLAAYPGRLDHAYLARKDVGPSLPQQPSTYLRRVHVDSMVFDHRQLEFLVGMYGADKVLLGTDYPYDMGDPNGPAMISGSALSADEIVAVRGGNAGRLFGLDPAMKAGAR